MRLSVVVQTKNAEQTLEQALRSVAFADELIVVDMESSDTTREIALKFTDN
ncbi:MAG: glycosyltransferase, partial [Candidatus Pacebacteria bacterium]|nr:glycosyltransferase [Candidatus Paceibacterota bacterium]